MGKVFDTVEEMAKLAGKVALLPDEYDQLVGMYNAFWSHPTVQSLMDRATGIEESFFCNDMETNIGLKARPDVLGADFILDYKTTGRGADTDTFSRVIADFDYDFSAAHYRSVVESVTGSTIKNFFLVAQETEAPYAIQVFRFSDACLDRAEMKRRQVLETLKVSFESNSWPTYTNEIKLIDVPAWKINKDEGVA